MDTQNNNRNLNGFFCRSSSIYTFQALSEEDRSLWMDAMDGKEPMYVHAPKPSNAHQVCTLFLGFIHLRAAS